MRILITGISGYVGAQLARRLRADGHHIRGFGRNRARVTAPVDDLIIGDLDSGQGLEQALADIDVAYYLVHSMDELPVERLVKAERRSAENFAVAARDAGLRRAVYLGGLVPEKVNPSRHIASRYAVEEIILASAPEALTFRASIVIGARSRSFQLLVRLIERLPVIALPSWRDNKTQPIDERDLLNFLSAAATVPTELTGRAWDISGEEVVTYAELVTKIAESMLVRRPTLPLNLTLPSVTANAVAQVVDESGSFIRSLMESLQHDLVSRSNEATHAFNIRLHTLDAAIEHALRVWETEQPLRAR